MITIFKTGYILLLSYNPCDVFTYFNVKEMHGLNAIDCAKHENTTESAYFAGWCNFIPKESGEYDQNDRRFIFINLSRCNDDTETMGLIMHEMMHQSLFVHNYDVANKEEEIILSILSLQPMHIDEIIKLSKLPTSVVNSTLTILEIKNAIRNLGKNNYIIK